ncbi:zinc-binding alcohol dehydrogenase [Ruficoccus sp. ZRK36]|uniref:zinc-dependent alcohol dehydrogenase n=1 Tax=Ruficoccus sp. ZRK36 TaxID=2866311 RepID=UPI001C730088|nr:zinc-binding alcohol dehydrogenase [Ruficoccus sp. ZRK36]QYY35648.1 zinc-binding alcohol dehydrogenase [Ruficoccus sp. ZRK36]
MKRKAIAFTAPGVAELVEARLPELQADSVLVRTEVSAISAGTERANLLDLPNLADSPHGVFPKYLGYSGVGHVVETGKAVQSVKPGDRVLTHWGSIHADYNVLTENNVVKIEDDSLAPEHAVFAVIAGFALNGLRKTRLEIGESTAVIGMGILGVFSLALCRIAGGSPVLAMDLSESRRQLALELGAHLTFDPTDADYIQQVKAASGGGVNAIIEVTGQSVALKQALDFSAKFGRIALLGCTRVSDTAIDYYQQVHRPGVEIIGAHTAARPSLESRPHSWTWQDDARALMRFMADGRLPMDKIVSTLYRPADASVVYTKLAENHHDFPIGAVFDWRD